MTFWLLLTVNSVTFGGLLFLLSAGFSLIFGLMRIPNLTHGSMFMVGAYLGTSLLGGTSGFTLNFWVAALIAAVEVAVLGALMERLASAGQVIGAVDQRKVREGLREIADQTLQLRIVLFA